MGRRTIRPLLLLPFSFPLALACAPADSDSLEESAATSSALIVQNGTGISETFTASGAVNDIGLCGFPVQLSFTETLARTNFFDQSGNLIRRHTFLTLPAVSSQWAEPNIAQTRCL